jgi:hypothetical protein
VKQPASSAKMNLFSMAKKTHTQPTDENKQQLAAFRKAARELGADESEERFKETLRTLAKAQPKKTEHSNNVAKKTKTSSAESKMDAEARRRRGQ